MFILRMNLKNADYNTDPGIVFKSRIYFWKTQA